MRLTLPAAAAWAAGTAAWALLLGFLARPGARAFTGSPGIESVVTRLGGRSGGAAAFLGFTFLTVAWLLALMAAGQVAALREEEARAGWSPCWSGPSAAGRGWRGASRWPGPSWSAPGCWPACWPGPAPRARTTG